MPKDSLLEFDTTLSGYVCGQLRAHLADLPGRPAPATRMPPPVWSNLVVSEWMGWAVGWMPTALADHIWAGVTGDAQHRSLTDEELGEIVLAMDDPPRRSESSAVWSACIWIHRRYIECLPVIHTRLAAPTADEWAAASIRYGATLSQPELPLGEGVDTVWAWLKDLRRHRRTIQGQLAGSTTRHSQSVTLAVGSSHDRPESPVCDWKEAMAISGLRKTKLYELFHQGRLKGFKDGGMIRFYHTGLAAYMKQQENTTALPTPSTPKRKPAPRPSAAGTRFKFL